MDGCCSQLVSHLIAVILHKGFFDVHGAGTKIITGSFVKGIATLSVLKAIKSTQPFPEPLCLLVYAHNAAAIPESTLIWMLPWSGVVKKAHENSLAKYFKTIGSKPGLCLRCIALFSSTKQREKWVC
ncbi:UNVERIFIED_CONTAM: hypothetical protein K2H54_030434 [Gekko kuhli]